MKLSETKRKSPPGMINRTLTAVLIATVLCFFSLFGWGMFLWVSLGFASAIDAIQRLNERQVVLLANTDSVSYLFKTVIPEKTSLRIHQLSQEVKAKSERVRHVMDDNLQSFELLVKKETVNLPLSTLFIEAKLFCLKLYWLASTCFHLLLQKTMLCLFAIPLFLLSALAGLVDGLNQRAIRTASLGRESTYVFHKSLPFARKTLFWILVVWLALPLNLNPHVLFVGLSVSLAWVMSITASRFKKYL